MKTVYPLQTKFAGGIIIKYRARLLRLAYVTPRNQDDEEEQNETKIIRNVLVSVKDKQKYNEKESCSILLFTFVTLETKTKMKKRKKQYSSERARF